MSLRELMKVERARRDAAKSSSSSSNVVPVADQEAQAVIESSSAPIRCVTSSVKGAGVKASVRVQGAGVKAGGINLCGGAYDEEEDEDPAMGNGASGNSDTLVEPNGKERKPQGGGGAADASVLPVDRKRKVGEVAGSIDAAQQQDDDPMTVVRDGDSHPPPTLVLPQDRRSRFYEIEREMLGMQVVEEEVFEPPAELLEEKEEVEDRQIETGKESEGAKEGAEKDVCTERERGGAAASSSDAAAVGADGAPEVDEDEGDADEFIDSMYMPLNTAYYSELEAVANAPARTTGQGVPVSGRMSDTASGLVGE
eukprot:GHVU01109852.1.p1 GENE.GHVU01109852.1~~GHVU01109852.1.p1  ORF type:complete len:311 (-),score=68.55 GHVU01109852.1:118-1050(-)